jgi:N-acetylneuraminate lyase
MTSEKGFNLIPAVFTPMSSDGNINPSIVEPYANYLYDRGMSTVFINGTTGESLSLTIEERKRMTDVWVNTASDNMQIIDQVGHNCLPAAKELARHARQQNVSAISVMTPIFLKPVTIDDLIDFLKEIASEAPDTPFYFYYIPSMSHFYFNMSEFLEKAVERIPTFAGVKYTHEDLLEFRRCTEKWNDKITLLFGRDELLLHGLVAGARGSVGTNYNIIGPSFLKLVNLFQSDQMEQAQLLADKTTAFTKLVLKFGLLSIGKMYMKELGIDCGDVRLPLTPEPEDKLDQFLKEISQLGLENI